MSILSDMCWNSFVFPSGTIYRYSCACGDIIYRFLSPWDLGQHVYAGKWVYKLLKNSERVRYLSRLPIRN
jgi:hypothetical protein